VSRPEPNRSFERPIHPTPLSQLPEQRARETIDRQLAAAGWTVQRYRNPYRSAGSNTFQPTAAASSNALTSSALVVVSPGESAVSSRALVPKSCQQ